MKIQLRRDTQIRLQNIYAILGSDRIDLRLGQMIVDLTEFVVIPSPFSRIRRFRFFVLLILHSYQLARGSTH